MNELLENKDIFSGFQKSKIKKRGNDSHKKAVLADLNQREKNTNISRPRLSGKVAAIAVGRGKREQKRKKVSYRTVLNTCLSFLNDVMVSEPFFEEQSDAVKMSETPYPTNGSGKNLAKDTGIKKAGIPGKSDFSLISYARLNIFFVLHL